MTTDFATSEAGEEEPEVSGTDRLPPDPVFASIARLAATVCETHLASISIPESGVTCWCTRSAALPLDQVPPRDPFLPYVAREHGMFTSPDVAHDLRFAKDECVTGPLAVRSYAGVALRTADARLRGTLAVYDSVARQLSPRQTDALMLLAQQAVAWMELRARSAEDALPENLGFNGSGGRNCAAAAVALLESAPVAIYQTDAAGNLTYVNPEYRRVFGLAPQQSADDWAQGVHPEDRARMERAWGDFCANPRPMSFEYRTAPRAGGVRHFSESVVPLDGTPAFVGTISDVTDLVSARSDLRRVDEEHKALLETLIAHLPLALIACDAEGRVTHYNREAAEICSMPRQGSSGEYSVGAEIYHADGVTPLARADRPLARTLRGEHVENLELVIVPQNSTERVTLSSGRRLLGPDGRPMGAVVVTQDITERRRAELELERVHEQLRSSARQAGMAEVATSILHNVGNVLTSINVGAALVAEGLKRSKASDLCRVAALLQAQGAQLGEFMTSDQRGKLVPSYLQALGEQLIKDTDAALEHMAALRKGLEHIKNVVAMQQNYARVTSVLETVSVVDLVEDSLRLSAGALTRHGVDLRREFDPTPPITVDKHRVLQILVNLVRNAKHACDESGKQDKLLTLRVEGDGTHVRILVIDNGVGIAPENMSRLFTHGFTTRPSGHGFGLHSGAIAAQELGGSLRAESAGPGQGATFILELPRKPPEGARPKGEG